MIAVKFRETGGKMSEWIARRGVARPLGRLDYRLGVKKLNQQNLSRYDYVGRLIKEAVKYKTSHKVAKLSSKTVVSTFSQHFAI